jgi:NADH-quinone oxidoreductase subunit E
MDLNLQEVDAIIDEWGASSASLLQIMLDINHRYHYLPEESVRRVSERLHMPLNQVFSVATFFKVFSLKPRGRTILHVCTGTACHVKGAPRLLDRLNEELDLKPGHTSEDLSFTLETVNCVGACSSAPVLVIGDQTHSAMNPKKVSKLVKKLRSEEADET